MVALSSLLPSAIVAPLILALVRSSSENLQVIPGGESQQNSSNISNSEILQGNPARTVIGRFVPDQIRLHSNKTLRWIKSLDVNSPCIVASDTGPCVKVSEAGIYEVVSQVAFRFDASSTTTTVAHSLLTVRDQKGEDLQRKMITLPARSNSLEKTEVFKLSSNLIAFVDVKSGDELCTILTPLENVYASILDNALTIVRL